MWTRPLEDGRRAMAPPMSAAAMLSRNAESTKTMASSAKPALPVVRAAELRQGACDGARLSSKWLREQGEAVPTAVMIESSETPGR